MNKDFAVIQVSMSGVRYLSRCGTRWVDFAGLAGQWSRSFAEAIADNLDAQIMCMSFVCAHSAA